MFYKNIRKLRLEGLFIGLGVGFGFDAKEASDAEGGVGGGLKVRGCHIILLVNLWFEDLGVGSLFRFEVVVAETCFIGGHSA